MYLEQSGRPTFTVGMVLEIANSVMKSHGKVIELRFQRFVYNLCTICYFQKLFIFHQISQF